MAVPTVVLLLIGPGRSVPSDIFSGVGGLAFLALALTFTSVGAIVASRVPGNRIGWILCFTGLAQSVPLLTWQYADVGLHHSPPLPGATVATVINTVLSEATAGVLVLPLLLFPDGRLPSRRWRPALAALLAGISMLMSAGALRPGRYDEPFAAASNPLGVPGARAAMNAVDAAGWLLVFVSLCLGACAMVVRLRRADGVQRQQLKVVLSVGAVVAVTAGLTMTTWLVWPHGHLRDRIAVLGLIFATLPAAIGVAILRYRLYDIDLIIRRTLVYGLVSGGLAGLYFAIVVALEQVLTPVAGGSTLAITGSTLAVAALFRPARTHVQTLVDRHFSRPTYDAERTLEAFAGRLRDEIDLDTLIRELRQVVGDSMQPAHVTLWLRDDAALGLAPRGPGRPAGRNDRRAHGDLS